MLKYLYDYQHLGWHKVRVAPEIKNTITEEWCKEFLKGNFEKFNNVWFFEDEKDAVYFSLVWN